MTDIWEEKEKITKVVVELDLSNLDEDITSDQIKNILLVYHNIGEGDEWTEGVPFTIKEFSVTGIKPTSK